MLVQILAGANLSARGRLLFKVYYLEYALAVPLIGGLGTLLIAFYWCCHMSTWDRVTFMPEALIA